jgi:hypothetical protein
MEPVKRTWALMASVAALGCLVMLFGCGGEEGSAMEADLIRSPRAGEECDRTWQGPAEDEAVAATLFLNRQSVQPGGRLWAAIENRGNSELAYGIEPLVKRRVGSEWVIQLFPDMAFPLLEITIDPKAVSMCIEVPIPSTWKPGLYRVNFEVSPYDSLDRVEGPGFPSYFRIRSQ